LLAFPELKKWLPDRSRLPVFEELMSLDNNSQEKETQIEVLDIFGDDDDLFTPLPNSAALINFSYSQVFSD